MKPRYLTIIGLAVLALMAVGCTSLPNARTSSTVTPEEQVSGTLGSPSATTTIDGKQLPPPPDKTFGGKIERNVIDSTPYWPPRVVPPKGAPNILLIMTDDAGYGVSSTFGGVIPTPSMDRIAENGLRYTNSMKADEFSIGYGAELAYQSDAHNNTVDYSANYYRFDFSIGVKAFSPYLGYEVLGGNADEAGEAFRTPLATLHAFNGWADKFLTTPDAGLKDLFVGAKGKLGIMNWNIVYHDFKAEDGSAKYGTELDASIGTSFAKNYGVLFKTAFFDGEPGSGYDDTTKLWVQLTASY